MTDYHDFLASKQPVVIPTGFEVSAADINPSLFPFQNAIVRWALRLGKAALFEECGLGKTAQQLEWAKHVAAYSSSNVLILAPLAVAHQTVKEGAKFGVNVRYALDQAHADQLISENAAPSIIITNYDRVERFDASRFAGIVLDESSILKNLGGKTFWQLFRQWQNTPFRLACTATPAPNEFPEFANHSTFLGIMHFKEVLMRWFAGDTKLARSAMLKKHAEADFWRWVTSWSVCISKPGDLGDEYDMPGYQLPPLELHEHVLGASAETYARVHAEGKLLPDTNPNTTTLHKVKRESLDDRVQRAVEIVGAVSPGEPVVVWCDTNYEADALVKAFKHFDGVVEVRGSDKDKEKKLDAFSDGQARIIITKPDIAGFGLNWQHCAQMVMVGVSFSFEKTYQALRRTYRFGQTRPVHAHLIYAETEGSVREILQEKQDAFAVMQASMNTAMREHGLFRDAAALKLSEPTYSEQSGDGWTVKLGDCVVVAQTLEDNSVDLTVHSPPFSELYIYSDSEADMGNSRDDEEFFRHYEYLIKELYRITTPGRLCVVHCKDLPAFKNRDGAMGLRDFPGEIIRRYEAHGWQYHSRVTIWKDPVVERERTNNHGLLWRNFSQQAEVVRQGMPDYLVVFRKWSDDMEALGKPVMQNRVQGDYIGTKPPQAWEIRPGRRSTEENYSIAVWQRYASPVWFDIQQTNVLNYQQVKDPNDEKHICPLQLDVIERCIDLWTNPGDVVFDPFAGIGSTLYSALKLRRRALGIELKPSYWRAAIKYCREAEQANSQRTLFDLMDGQEATGD